MRVLTLGRLALEGSDFSRSKPLLLLAYLSIAGEALERRHVAELFWHGKSDHLNSLSSALNQLRKLVPGSVVSDDVRVWTEFGCDVGVLEAAFEQRDFAGVVAAYGGPFLETVNASRLGEELETWVLETREGLASKVQEAYLQLAELKATKGDFVEAASLAEAAFVLPGALEPEPESLGRYFVLLQAGGSAFADKVRLEAEGFGISFDVSDEDARSRLQTVLLGRDDELERLASLELGSWVWLSGPSGMGKTALLKALAESDGSSDSDDFSGFDDGFDSEVNAAGLSASAINSTYVQARKGLPYVTLEPFIKDVLAEGEEAMLRKLLSTEGFWLTDAWELMDAESQALLRRLRDLRPDLTMVIASQDDAQLATDSTFELKPLTQEDLARYEGLFELTGGVPALVAAQLRGDALESVLSHSLSVLSESARSVYLCLALLDTAQLRIIRKALDLTAAEFAEALEALVKSSLIDSAYEIRARQAAQDFLLANPIETSQLALVLARHLKGTEAFGLYEQAKGFWTEADFQSVAESYFAWASELLKRGFPKRVVSVLEACPEVTKQNLTEKIILLKARALHRTGQNSAALELLDDLESSPEVSALSAMIHWRLGSPGLATEQARFALKGDTHAKASAENVLGHLALAAGEFVQAQRHFKKAAVLWQVLGEKGLRAYALNNEANAKYQLGEPIEAAYEKALSAAEGNPMVQTSILNNLAVLYHKTGQVELAKKMFEQAIDLATEVGSLTVASESWNNLGAFLFDQKKEDDALEAYAKALDLAREAEDISLIALAMANQAEITADVDTLEMAIELLQSAGYTADAALFMELLPEDHALRDS